MSEMDWRMTEGSATLPSPSTAPTVEVDDLNDGPDLTHIDIPEGSRNGNVYEQLCAAWHREPCGHTKAAIGEAILALHPIYDAPLDDLNLTMERANAYLKEPAEYGVWAGDIDGIESFAQYFITLGWLRAAKPSARETAPEVSQQMLERAMKRAVASGLIARYADEAAYLKNWDGMKTVLSAALGTAAPSPQSLGKEEDK